MQDVEQKLRQALRAIANIDDATSHSADASAALDRIGQIARQALAPAQEIDKSVADAEIKAMYVESQGSDKGWLGIEGSYFIGGVVAARKQKAAPAPAQEVGLTDEGRQQVFIAAERRMVREPNLSWRDAIVDEVIAALRAKEQS